MSKISVIVPVYKVEEYLDRCVESILAQTFKDFELILVDDGSPDNCPQMCDEWAKKDARIRVIHKQNAGVSSARNDGVVAANSELITFVDSDDWIYPNLLEVLYNNLIEYSADISVTKFFDTSKNYVDSNNIKVYDNCEAIYDYGYIDDERFRACMAKLIKKDIVLENPFPLDRIYSEDMAVIYKWYYSAKTVVGTEQLLYYYNRNEISVSSKTYGLHRLGDLKTWNELIKFLKTNNFDKLYDHKIAQYANALYTQYNQLISINEYDIAKKVKAELKKICVQNSCITIKTQTHLYNCIYPLRMRLYWNIKGVLENIKCRK